MGWLNRTGRSATYTLPDCLVVGPQRAGTTWIHRYLETHPNVVVPTGVKETFFFDRRYRRGIDWYARHFRVTSTATMRVVEVAPSYFHHPELPSRVLKELGAIPLLCTLRNPAERSYSLYLLLRSYGLTRGEFRAAARQHPEILDTSRYGAHAARWIKYFGRDQIQFLFQETLASDPDEYARQICEHLDVPTVSIDESLAAPVNRPSVPSSERLARLALRASELARGVGAYPLVALAKRLGLKRLCYGQPGGSNLPRLTAADRRWIYNEVAAEIDALETLLDVDLSHWKASSSKQIAA